MAGVTPGEAECLALLETQDPDRAVSLAFVPEDKRGALAALYAFNVETARIRESVSQPLPGEIRLQWWRDTIEGPGSGRSSGNPVAEALGDAIERHSLPKDALDRFIEARIFDLYDDPMPTRVEFEGYAGDTASALIMLACLVLAPERAREAAEAAGHAGVAQAAAGALRLMPLHRRQGHVLIPADILDAVGCSSEALLAGEPEPAGRAIAAMVAFAREHEAAFRSSRKNIAPDLRAAFLPALLTKSYLERIVRQGADALDAPATVGPLKRSFIYWRGMRN